MVCLMTLLLMCTLYCEWWMITAMETIWEEVVLLVGTKKIRKEKPQDSGRRDRDWNTSQLSRSHLVQSC
jgi:hypothetical protein